jgi:hypothetical protein
MATGRIGVTPTLRTRWSKQPTAGTTSLSGLDDNSVALVYDVGYEAVYRNGALLSRGNDYTATNGTTVTLIDATLAGDIIEILANQLVPLTDAISKGQFNAKGALLSATAASTPGVLAVGANDTVLTADSTTSTGLKWAAPAAGATLLTQSTSANYYKTSFNSPIANSDPIAFQATFYFPVYLPTGTADRLVIRAASAWTGTSTARLGIYNNTNGLPTTVKVDAGTVSVTTANTVYSITISTAITAGWYWLACNVTDGGGSNSYSSFDLSSANTTANGFVSSITSSAANTKLPVAYYQTGVTGAFATAGTLLGLDAFSPATMVRVS